MKSMKKVSWSILIPFCTSISSFAGNNCEGDLKYLALSSEERAYLNPESNAFKKHTNELILKRARNYCSKNGQELDESRLNLITFSDYSGNEPLVNPALDENLGRTQYPLWNRWFYTDNKKSNYVKFAEHTNLWRNLKSMENVKSLMKNEKSLEEERKVIRSVFYSCFGTTTGIAGTIVLLAPPFICPPFGIALMTGAACMASASVASQALTNKLEKKTGQTQVRKLTYAKALKKLERGKNLIGTGPAAVKVTIKNSELVPHLLFESVPCVDSDSNKSINFKMTEVLKQPSRTDVVQDNTPSNALVVDSNLSEDLNSDLPPTYEEALRQRQSAGAMIDQNEERVNGIVQMLTDLPAPPTGFSIEVESDSENEEEFPIAILE